MPGMSKHHFHALTTLHVYRRMYVGPGQHGKYILDTNAEGQLLREQYPSHNRQVSCALGHRKQRALCLPSSTLTTDDFIDVSVACQFCVSVSDPHASRLAPGDLHVQPPREAGCRLLRLDGRQVSLRRRVGRAGVHPPHEPRRLELHVQHALPASGRSRQGPSRRLQQHGIQAAARQVQVRFDFSWCVVSRARLLSRTTNDENKRLLGV